MKKLIPLICIVLIFVQSFNVNADSVIVVSADDNLHFYLLNHYDTENWDESDFLTIDNYDDYYDNLTGSQKTDIINKFVDTSLNNKYSAMINDFIHPEYTTQSGITIKNIYAVPPIYNGNVVDFDDCEIIIIGLQNGSTNPFAVYCFYSPTGNDFIISGNTIISSQPYILTYQPYNWYIDTSYDGTNHLYYVPGSAERITIDTLNSQYNCYGSTMNTSAFDGCIFSTIPYLFTSNSLSGINNDYNSYQSYLNGVSYAIDRRTDRFINVIDPNGGGSGMNDIVTLDYDPTLFNGVLGFNWFNPSCSLNYNQHTSSYFPYYIVKYQINNYTDIHKTECSLIIDADIGLKLSVDDPNNAYDGSGAYATISHYHYNNELLLNDNLDGFTLFATSNSNSWTNTSLRTSRGFNTQTNLNPFSGDLTSDINNIISQWNTTASISRTNSYGNFRLNFYVRNNITGEVSETFTADFNLLTNQYTDNRNDIISNDNQEFIDFKNSFDYQDNNGDYLPVDYANYVNSGGSSSSVGDITIYQNPYPYILVDIPENEWMNYTPNLKTLLTDFKTMLAETKDDSILKMLPETYNYFPAPFMQYMLYGIGIIIMIGIWRAITRR